MREYKITDGKSIIIERAKSETLARVSAAKRLDCDMEQLRCIRTKKLPQSWRERKEAEANLKYAEYLLQIQRGEIEYPGRA